MAEILVYGALGILVLLLVLRAGTKIVATVWFNTEFEHYRKIAKHHFSKEGQDGS